LTFSRAKALGYSPGNSPTAAELNIIDLNQSRALDMTAGGTYSPAGQVVWNGSYGISFTGTTSTVYGSGTQSIFSSGSFITLASGSTVSGASGSALTMAAGSTTTLSGATNSGGTLTLTGGTKLKYNSRSIVRLSDRIDLANASTADWVRSTSGYWSAGTANKIAFFAVHVPHGATLTQVRLWLTGNGGALPGTQTELRVWRSNVTLGTITQFGATTNDAQGSAAAYNAIHAFGVSSSMTIDRTLHTVWGQITADSLASSRLWGVEVTYTSTEQDED
jgi:hypothetical protein